MEVCIDPARRDSPPVVTTGQYIIMSTSNSTGSTPRLPPPRSQSMALSPKVANQLQETLARRSQPNPGQSTPGAAMTEDVKLVHALKPKLAQGRRHATHQAFAGTSGPAQPDVPQSHVPQPYVPQSPRPLMSPQPPQPLPLPRTPRQLSTTLPVSGASQAVIVQDPPMQPAAVTSVQDVARHIDKALAAPRALDVRRNPVREPGGETRLDAVCKALFNMIEGQAVAVDRTRLHGQLALALLNYAGVDKTLEWNKDRFDAALRILQQIDQKLESPHEDMRSMLVWLHVKKAVLHLTRGRCQKLCV
jgi:hypothetical protein